MIIDKLFNLNIQGFWFYYKGIKTKWLPSSLWPSLGIGIGQDSSFSNSQT